MNRKMLFSPSSHRPNGPTFGLTFSAFALAAAALAHSESLAPIAAPVPTELAGATVVGHVSSSKVINLSMGLLPNRAALKAYADAVNDPLSPDYHRFLSPSQVGERFGASANTVNAAVSYLKGKGMTITMVADNRMTILFKGKVSSIESAFSTKINNYKVASRPTKGPLTFYSNATIPKVPASLASKVVCIGNLDNANPPVPMTTNLTPSQSRGLYGAAGLYSAAQRGKGVTVAISNLGDGYRLSNVPIFYNTFNLPAPAGGVGSNIIHVSVGSVDGNTEPEGAETNLDIQMALGEAPNCSLIVYDGFDVDFYSVISREYNDDLADILSESWGVRNSDAVLEAAADLHASMSISGMTYLAASGDTGTNEFSSYPHGDPNVLAVGGTDATVSDANGTRVVENGWDGSGSGYDPSSSLTYNHLPSYQRGRGVPTGIDKRLYPDVGVHATGSQIIIGGSPTVVAGTSSSSPQLAGILALMLESLKLQDAADSYVGKNGVSHFRLGQLNAFIYGLNGDSTSFFDVTTGDTGLLPNGQEATGAVGWDFVTGWGAPIASGLTNALLSNGSVAVSDAPGAPSIYVNSALPTGFGTSPTGGATELPTADGISYTVQSVRQKGVGQIAAVTIPVSLQTAKQRRSASVKVVMTAPKLTTGTIYLLNKNTNQYDLISTVTNTGVMTTTTIPLDVTSAGLYISANKVTMLVRGLKPSRLGNSPFTLTVDQAVVIEKVPRA